LNRNGFILSAATAGAESAATEGLRALEAMVYTTPTQTTSASTLDHFPLAQVSREQNRIVMLYSNTRKIIKSKAYWISSDEKKCIPALVWIPPPKRNRAYYGPFWVH
jgi:hypothetical protein